LLIDGEWTDAARGCYAVIPGSIPHDFENRGFEECGFISINAPAGFEEKMPDIVKWCVEHPLGDVADA
jgi:mannose-6-phosphate isomerase-like protein (cupin superfamily)